MLCFFLFIKIPLGGRDKNGDERKPTSMHCIYFTLCLMFAAPFAYLVGKFFCLVVVHITASKLILSMLSSTSKV